MKTLPVLLGFALCIGCGAAQIPDDIPPAPPARKGDAVRAPSLEVVEEPPMEGFGGEGFGGVTPTVEVPEQPVAPEPEDPDDADDDAADDAEGEAENAEKEQVPEKSAKETQN